MKTKRFGTQALIRNVIPCAVFLALCANTTPVLASLEPSPLYLTSGQTASTHPYSATFLIFPSHLPTLCGKTGSACGVKNDKILLTCGHNLYLYNKYWDAHFFASDIVVYRAWNGWDEPPDEQADATLTEDSYIVMSGYQSAVDAYGAKDKRAFAKDFGVIRSPSSLHSNIDAYWNNGYDALKSDSPKLITGYPNTLDPNPRSYYYMYETGPFNNKFYSVYGVSCENFIHAYNITSYPGNSGGPVWVKDAADVWRYAGVVVSKHWLTTDLSGVVAVSDSEWALVDQVIATIPPDPPTSLNYPDSSASGSYTITWSSSPRATSYRLEVSSNGGTSWFHVTTTPETSYPDTRPNGGYRYRIRAVSAAGNSGWNTGSHDCVVNILSGQETVVSVSKTLTSAADTYVDRYRPTENFSTELFLPVVMQHSGVDNPRQTTAYVAFDCSVLPSDATITEVQLILAELSTISTDTSYPITLWKTAPFDASTVCYNTRPSRTSGMRWEVYRRPKSIWWNWNTSKNAAGYRLLNDVQTAVSSGNWAYFAFVSDSTDNNMDWPIFLSKRLDSYEYYMPRLCVDYSVTVSVTKPTSMSGPTSGLTGESLRYEASGASSSHGSSVQYKYYWGDGTDTGWSSSSRGKTYDKPGTYHIKARARCATHKEAESDLSDVLKTVTITKPHTVNTPTTPTGPSSGYVDTSYEFSTGGSSCAQGHSVQYQFDWGDGTQSGWGGSSAFKSYGTTGSKSVKARARCAVDTSIVSEWSEAKSVTINQIPTHNLSVTSAGANQVTIGSNTEHGGTTPFNHTVAQGTTVHLAADAYVGTGADRKRFTEWTGDISTTEREISFAMDAGMTLVANYVDDPERFVDTPAFNPDGGTASGNSVNVTITCATPGATIRYTTNGGEPTEASPSVDSGGMVSVSVPGTLKAKAFKAGMNPSATKSARYTSAGTVATPAFSPDGGTQSGSSVNVTITCATPGATIRYTSGSGTTPSADPTTASTQVPASGIVNVPVPGWLKAKAWKEGMSESVVKSAVWNSSQQPILSVMPPMHEVTKEAGTTTFNVMNTGSGTMNWTAAVTSGGTWARITTGASGKNAGTVTVSFDANPPGSPQRTATIRVTATGATGSPFVVNLTQEENPVDGEGVTVQGNSMWNRHVYFSWQNITHVYQPDNSNAVIDTWKVDDNGNGDPRDDENRILWNGQTDGAVGITFGMEGISASESGWMAQAHRDVKGNGVVSFTRTTPAGTVTVTYMLGSESNKLYGNMSFRANVSGSFYWGLDMISSVWVTSFPGDMSLYNRCYLDGQVLSARNTPVRQDWVRGEDYLQVDDVECGIAAVLSSDKDWETAFELIGSSKPVCLLSEVRMASEFGGWPFGRGARAFCNLEAGEQIVLEAIFQPGLSSADSRNVALQVNGGVATAGSVGTYMSVSHPAANANDGDVETGWCNSWLMPDWLKVEFDQNYVIDRVGVVWGVGAHNQTFSISLSTDGNNWTTVVAPRDSSTDAEYNGSEYHGNTTVSRETFPITPMSARFIKIDVTASSAPQSHIFKAIVHELQAYKTGQSVPVATPVHRFWSPVFSAHFFTINEVEKNNVIRNLSQYWTYECVAYEAYTARVPGTVPLYRFWSPVFSGHFFTINETEKNNVIRNLSQYWTYEGVAYYVYPSPAAGTAPVYRFWSPVFSHHFYTINETEKNNVIRNLWRYWDYETVAFYAIPTARSRSIGAAAAGAVVQEPEDEGAVGFTGSMAGQYVGATEPADDGASARPLVTMSSPVPANAPLALDVAIPLECSGLTVWAYARAEGTDEWGCILDGAESPDAALLTGLAADSAYQVEIWAADPEGGAPFRLQAGLIEQTTEVPDDVFEMDAIGMWFTPGAGNPLVGLTVPDTCDSLTLQLASPWEGALQSVGPAEGGAGVVFELPACNRWYWIGEASEAAARVLPRWLRYKVAE